MNKIENSNNNNSSSCRQRRDDLNVHIWSFEQDFLLQISFYVTSRCFHQLIKKEYEGVY